MHRPPRAPSPLGAVAYPLAPTRSPRPAHHHLEPQAICQLHLSVVVRVCMETYCW